MPTQFAEDRHFDILVMPETTLILMAAVIEPLRAANRIAGRDLYRWTLLSPDGQPAETTSGIPIPVSGAFRPERRQDPLFVLASYNWRRGATREMKVKLARAAPGRSLIAGIESGAWLLADAGLLDGHAVTTHWEDMEEFSSAYPQIEMRRERFVTDRKRITTGGPLPTLDLMLDLIRRDRGHSLALEVSRLFIYEQAGTERRSGGPAMSGILTASSGRAGDPRLAAAVRLMEETVDMPLVMTRLARRAGVSPRHLQDLFHRHLGVSPAEHYLALRLNAARRRVIESSVAFSEIAEATGFNSASAFSRCYRAHFRESPSETRLRLKPPR